MHVHRRIVMMILLALGAALLAQERPNFSGEWALNRQASSLSPGADGVKGGTWRIEHQEPRFALEASFVTDRNPIEWRFELQTDGREAVGTRGGATTASRLAWDGLALVVTMRTERPGVSEMIISFRYELVDGGRRLRAVEQLRGTDHDQENVWVFDRR